MADKVGYKEVRGKLFKVEEADKHLLCIAEKIAKKKNIEYEKMGDLCLFIFSEDVDIQSEVQDELNKMIHVSKKK